MQVNYFVNRKLALDYAKHKRNHGYLVEVKEEQKQPYGLLYKVTYVIR